MHGFCTATCTARHTFGPMDLAAHGDVLERDNADFIKSSLPGYARIWAEYIGNDGSSRPAPTPGTSLGEEEARKRSLTSQHIYTALESVLALRRLAAAQLPTTTASGTDLLDVANLMLLAHAHMGRIRDQVKKLGELWGLPLLAGPLEDYYQRRNTVLHGAKVPFSIIQGATIIALPAEDDADANKWGDKRSTWTDCGKAEREFLDQYLAESAGRLATIVNSALEKVYADKIKPYLRATNFPQLPDPTGPASALVPSGTLP